MSLYSSREPFNDDPEWFCGKCGGKSWEHAQSDSRCIWEPVDLRRPEYNRPQNNPTNPILACFRGYAEGRVSWLAAHWTSTNEMWSEMVPSDEKLDEHMGSSEQEDHARKVLTRLAALEKEES